MVVWPQYVFLKLWCMNIQNKDMHWNGMQKLKSSIWGMLFDTAHGFRLCLSGKQCLLAPGKYMRTKFSPELYN